ncbi:Peptide deformylase [Pseudolycoriella hygida]|uniref:Peptide deformylase n=1 Tax=Pseudolycoriella hygida TaxID=35572 RepID=A0A9Q0NFX4_9DIPT|nr:Peptide deformylase [Pseudolycoriella hygida]
MEDSRELNGNLAIKDETPVPSPYDASWVQATLCNISHLISPSVLLVGEPQLRMTCESVALEDIKCEKFLEEKYRLHRALMEFRNVNGFGRSIAAPQIGVTKRFLAINMGKGMGMILLSRNSNVSVYFTGPFTLINPTITFKSEKLISLWDDCMSFPFLLVRKQRHASVSVKFVDDEGVTHEWKDLDTATSELLQHEIDHLDGILALDEPFGKNGIVSREVYEKNREYFDREVDYVIEPTI